MRYDKIAHKRGYNMKTITLLLIITMVFLLSCEKKTTEPDIQKVATPVVSPASGSYTDEFQVTITCETQGVTIRYTTNGNDPTDSSSLYTGHFAIQGSTTIKARAFKPGWNNSDIAVSQYTTIVKTPSIIPSGGSYTSAQFVTMDCATTDVAIKYTIDGSEPNTYSTTYSNPVTITSTTTLRAKAFRNGWTPSQTVASRITIGISPSQTVPVDGGQVYDGTAYVTLSQFRIGTYEITQSEYGSVMGSNPSHFVGYPNRPVENVTWFNAIEFCNRRSILEGLTPAYSYGTYGADPDNWPSGWGDVYGDIHVVCNFMANGYRLPTKFEWMFAAKGGNLSQNYTYSGSNDFYQVAWFWWNSDNRTHEVGTLSANELGIYDMSGNVSEWCWDLHGAYRYLYGGSYEDSYDNCTVESWISKAPYTRYFDRGFRVCRSGVR